MPEPTTEKKPKKRARRNFAKELERIESYCETVLRIYAQEIDAETAGEFRKGQCRAYGDILALIQGGSK